jgi:hypothetical protein
MPFWQQRMSEKYQPSPDLEVNVPWRIPDPEGIEEDLVGIKVEDASDGDPIGWQVEQQLS